MKEKMDGGDGWRKRWAEGWMGVGLGERRDAWVDGWIHG